MKKWIWIIWLLGCLGLAVFYSYQLLASEDKSAFLIGEATHGHHQIELACGSCHLDPFGGGEVLQQACTNCHGDELVEANDSHPMQKFTDPRNADRLAHLDARFCVTCHTEHQLEQTGQMGVTIAGDFCAHCHQDIGEDRPSHMGMAFDTCASAGCHNYHDNRALYENFLVKNSQQPFLLELARSDPVLAAQFSESKRLLAAHADAPASSQNRSVTEAWAVDLHAAAGVNCSGCHQTELSNFVWEEKPGMAVCATCHDDQAETFIQGKHGMRLNPALKAGQDTPLTLSAMSPALGRLTFAEGADQHGLTCNSCHSAHRFDRAEAAVDSCLNCHADEHSLAYQASPHFKLWQRELEKQAPPGTGVSCATCHMPSLGAEHGQGFIQHNQSENLRPNEKMIRPVCMDCHGLGFAIDALSDPHLINNNFNGRPSTHIESIDMALEREHEQ